MKRRILLLTLCATSIIIHSCDFILKEPLRRAVQKNESITGSESKPASTKVEDGVSRKYRDDGKLLSEIPMKNGKRHGLARDYYVDGIIHHEIEYAEGLKHGVAKTFYQSGILYMESNYHQGLLYGERKIFKENGEPSSIVAFKNNLPGKGLIEYTSDGSMKKKYPGLLIKPIDKISTHDEYVLEISFTEKSRKKPEIYIGALEEGKFIHGKLYLLRQNDKQTAKIDFELPPQTYIKKEIDFVGVFYTALGNPYVVEKKYYLDISNLKNE